MILVGTDTSTRWAGVGLQTESGDRTEMVWRSDQNHGRELMPAIVELTSRAGLTPADITHLAVALGPGGFSAVRVGISTVIGLALPRELPTVGIPTHMLEAHPFLDRATTETPVVSLIPAGRNELSWAAFISKEPAHETGLAAIEEIPEQFNEKALFCGEGADAITGMVSGDRILSSASPTRSPLSLLEIADQRFSAGKATPPTELRPIYARPPSITMRKVPGQQPESSPAQ